MTPAEKIYHDEACGLSGDAKWIPDSCGVHRVTIWVFNVVAADQKSGISVKKSLMGGLCESAY